jgi:hypothetical protein
LGNRRDDGSINAIAGPERLLLRTPVALYGEDLRTVGISNLLLVPIKRRRAQKLCRTRASGAAASSHPERLVSRSPAIPPFR